ncbi:hypothetical protein HOU91_gp26 [Enterobacter phage EcpYZU01]|uniref:hypothetical protein n=1 Tax=Enterobacter phage EcpYZU01 TaxID=2483604 RepID=UPI0018ACE914|nr:hypothetical protein HOU91_gp26 [Enterobacter phage EcpYZU01]
MAFMINPNSIQSGVTRMYQNTINFERNRERQQTEGYIPKGRKLNKTKRGGGVKGAFRNAEGKDSMINQEKYFVGA